MKYVLCILALFTIVTSCAVKNKHRPTNDILAVWNQKTLNSISEQLSTTNDEALKKKLQNHLYAAKMSLYDSITQDNGKEEKSFRAKFLDTIFSSNTTPNDFFVLEFVERGEKYKIKNVLVENVQNTSKAIFYEYLDNKWQIVGDTTLKKIDLHNEVFRPFQVKDRIDLGLRHVILSEFNKADVVSYYYADGMVDKHNIFFDLLTQSINSHSR